MKNDLQKKYTSLVFCVIFSHLSLANIVARESLIWNGFITFGLGCDGFGYAKLPLARGEGGSWSEKKVWHEGKKSSTWCWPLYFFHYQLIAGHYDQFCVWADEICSWNPQGYQLAWRYHLVVFWQWLRFPWSTASEWFWEKILPVLELRKRNDAICTYREMSGSSRIVENKISDD